MIAQVNELVNTCRKKDDEFFANLLRLSTLQLELLSHTIPDDYKEYFLKDINEDSIPIESTAKKITIIEETKETENKVETSVTIVHNPKAKLSSIIKPYIAPVAISVVLILVYVAIRYKKLGILPTVANYVVYPVAVEAVYLSILAITRFPINRLVVPIGLVLYVTTVTVLSVVNEKKLSHAVEEEKKK